MDADLGQHDFVCLDDLSRSTASERLAALTDHMRVIDAAVRLSTATGRAAADDADITSAYCALIRAAIAFAQAQVRSDKLAALDRAEGRRHA